MDTKMPSYRRTEAVPAGLSLVKFVIEYDGKVLLNNEYTAEIKPNRPLLLQWFTDNDLFVEYYPGSKFVLNTANLNTVTCARVIKIMPDFYIIQPRPTPAEEKDLKVISSSRHGIFPKKYTVEIAEGADSTYLTVEDKTNKVAVNLNIKIDEHNIEINNSKIILKAHAGTKQIFVIYNPQSSQVEHYITADSIEYGAKEITAAAKLDTVLGHVRITKFEVREGIISFREAYIAASEKAAGGTEPAEQQISCERHELPFAFLQCVKLRDYENARAMLAFEISGEHLYEYFGEFEILLNNYQNTPDTVSILPASDSNSNYVTAKNIHFHIENNKIINID